MLDRARSRKFSQLLTHNLESYPYPHADSLLMPGSFDVVVCVGVMDFISNPRAFLQHARSFLKKSSPEVLSAAPSLPTHPVAADFVHGDGGVSNGAPRGAIATLLPTAVLGVTMPEWHSHSDLSSFSRLEMEDLLRDCGFLVERHERFMGYHDSKSGLIQYYHGWLCVLNEQL